MDVVDLAPGAAVTEDDLDQQCRDLRKTRDELVEQIQRVHALLRQAFNTQEDLLAKLDKAEGRASRSGAPSPVPG
ncbi:Uncharacterized protein PBTT_06765 [Plasmodiophora brassicae]